MFLEMGLRPGNYAASEPHSPGRNNLSAQTCAIKSNGIALSSPVGASAVLLRIRGNVSLSPHSSVKHVLDIA